MKKIVSIVTRTRRRTAFLERALKSVVGQVLPSDISLEWVIVNDDNETDGLNEVVASAQAEGLMVKLLHTGCDSGIGRAAAANFGVNASSGWAFLLHDDDDALEPDAIGQLAGRLQSCASLVGCAGGVVYVWEMEQNGVYEEQRRELAFAQDLPLAISQIAYANPVPPIGLLVLREAYDRVGGFDESLPVLEDWDLLLKLVLEGDIDCLSQPIALHYRREAVGDAANSAHSEHERWGVLIRNRLIRDDIRNGRMGLSHFAVIHDRLTSERLSRLLESLSRWKRKIGL